MRYVRSYPAELPVLAALLPQIHVPVQIIAGAHDRAVPPANAEFLHERLPRSKLDIIDAGHFTWEDAAAEYAALVTSWWAGGYAERTGNRNLTRQKGAGCHERSSLTPPVTSKEWYACTPPSARMTSAAAERPARSSARGTTFTLNSLRAMPSPALAADAPGRRLRGRRSECEALDRLLASVRAGQSQVLVLRGEAGAGKTALLDYLLERASGCRIAQAAGVESEMELAFAGLHQLCAPFLDRLDRLPGPQRDALGTAFSLRDGDTPDRFAVGLAVLSLLSDVGRGAAAGLRRGRCALARPGLGAGPRVRGAPSRGRAGRDRLRGARVRRTSRT